MKAETVSDSEISGAKLALEELLTSQATAAQPNKKLLLL